MGGGKGSPSAPPQIDPGQSMGEYLFGNYRSTEHVAELDSGDRDDRKKSIFKRMLVLDHPLGQPLGSSGDHILFAQLLDH